MAEGQLGVSSLEALSQEVALSSDEVERILRACGTDALLVGGQALAAWALYYQVEPTGVLSRAITMDAHYVGTAAVAEALQRQLGRPWTVRYGTLDDAGGQVAKVFAKTSDGVKQIDFLSGIVGLDTETIRRRASHISFPDGVTVAVLHPLDVLESRLRNLDSLPAKRNETGVAQAQLAVLVARAFINEALDSGDRAREVRQALRRVQNIALDSRLSHVAFTYEIDVPRAIPVERMQAPKFLEEQWPRFLSALQRKREKFAKLQSRRIALKQKANKGRP